MFLLPHSPGFSPIEEAFSKVKALLRKAAASTCEPMGRALYAVTARDAWSWFAHCGNEIGAHDP